MRQKNGKYWMFVICRRKYEEGIHYIKRGTDITLISKLNKQEKEERKQSE